MAFPVELLTDHALCDAALAEIQTELEDLLYRQSTYSHRDSKATARAEDVNQEIATLDTDITKYTADIPTLAPGSRNRLRREAELRAAIKRRGDLGASLTTTGPVAAFRIAVDLAQIVKSGEVLNLAKTDVTNHRATLTA